MRDRPAPRGTTTGGRPLTSDFLSEQSLTAIAAGMAERGEQGVAAGRQG